MLESFFLFRGARAGGIHNLDFSNETAHFSHNAKGSQYEHFHGAPVDIATCYATLSS